MTKISKMSEIKKYAVIVAGGKGQRMGTAIPKQFLDLAGKPMLYYSIAAFTDAYPDIEVILVLPEDMLSYAQIILTAFPAPVDMIIVPGGATRYHSVKNGLNAIKGNGIVFVHDGARPLVSKALINRCYKQATEKGNAIPAIAATDSMRITDGRHTKPIDRDYLRIIQTPQTFRTEIIIPAFQQDYDPAFTDEATVLEATGMEVYLTEGDKRNIKVTTPEDMMIAAVMLKDDLRKYIE